MATFDAWLTSTADVLDSYASQTTVLRVPALEAWAIDLGAGIGFPADQVKYTLGMLMAFPLAMVFALLPHGTVRHAFSMLTGMFIAQFALGSGWIHSFASATIVYLIIAATSGMRGLDKHRHILVFFFMMAYMTGSHIYRVYIDYMGWTLDFTGPQMLLTIKLTTMAFNLYDGTVDADNLRKKSENKSDDKKAKGEKRLADARLDRSINGLPNIIEYFGYVFCFTSYLAGPAFDIKEYLSVCNGTKFNGKPAPARALTALWVTVQAFVFVGLMVWGTANFPITLARDSEWLAKTAFASPAGWFKHVGHVWLALFFVRAKYYFGWLLSEGSSIVSGFGYSPKDKNWRGARNVDWLGFETAMSVRDGARAWNQRTQAWLEQCVYTRTGGSLNATYFVSAFWHGFYPGYYLFFLSVPLATTVNRLAFKKVRPMFYKDAACKEPKSTKILYDIFSMIVTSLIMNYLATVFQVLSWEYAVLAWKAYYFLGHITLIVMYIALAYVIKSPKSKKN